MVIPQRSQPPCAVAIWVGLFRGQLMRKNLIILAGILTGVMAVVNYCQYETAMDSALEEVARFEQFKELALDK